MRAALLYSLWGAVLELKSKIEVPEIKEITFDSTVKGGIFVWVGSHPRGIPDTFSLKGVVEGMALFLDSIREGRYGPSLNIIEIFGLRFRWEEWIRALQYGGHMDSIILHMHKWYKDNSNRWGELLRRVDSAVSRAAQLISEPYDEWPLWLLWAQALAVTTVQFTPEKLPPYVVNTERPSDTLRPWVGFPLEGARSVKIIIPAPVGQTLRHLGVSLQDFKQMIVDLVKERYVPRTIESVIKEGTKWQCTLNYSNEAEGSK